jgi:hypothetical protein
MPDRPVAGPVPAGPQSEESGSAAPRLSDAKRTLLERYRRGQAPEGLAGADASATTSAGDGRRSLGDGNEPRARERLVTIQSGGRQRPFFFLHGQWEQGGFFCFRMAKALGRDRPFHALEPYDFDGLPNPPSLESIAAAHLRSIRTVQPEGPYLLGGWCNGALLAYEMARQLRSAGQQVELLVLMDPVYLVYPMRLRWVRAVIRRAGGMMRLAPGSQLRFYLAVRQTYRRAGHLHSYLRDPSYRARTRLIGFGREDYPGIYDWGAMGYAPDSIYPGKVTFFWSIKEPFRRGWSAVEQAGQVEVQVLPCSHITCFTDYIEELSQHLRDCLLAAEAAAMGGRAAQPIKAREQAP